MYVRVVCMYVCIINCEDTLRPSIRPPIPISITHSSHFRFGGGVAFSSSRWPCDMWAGIYFLMLVILRE